MYLHPRIWDSQVIFSYFLRFEICIPFLSTQGLRLRSHIFLLKDLRSLSQFFPLKDSRLRSFFCNDLIFSSLNVPFKDLRLISTVFKDLKPLPQTCHSRL